MSKTANLRSQWLRRKRRVRKKIYGYPERPRMTIFRSNSHIYAQIVDDDGRKTLASASSREKDISTQRGELDKKGVAKLVGASIANKAKAAGITSVVFDRNGFRFHGRVAALAAGAREGGLEF